VVYEIQNICYRFSYGRTEPSFRVRARATRSTGRRGAGSEPARGFFVWNACKPLKRLDSEK